MTPQPYAPAGQLQVHTSFFFAFWILFLITPRIEINGQPYPRRWGISTFDLPAGHYRVEVSYRYFVLSKAGRASFDVRVDPGQCTMVSYRAPWFIFLWGGTMKLLGARPAAPQQLRA
jgi:hypothetical protein